MTDSEMLQWFLEEGHASMNADGIFKLSDKAHAELTKLINEKPELYSKIFPDRVN